MTKKKISIMLGGLPQGPEISIEKLLDSLTQRIFLPEMDFKTLISYYIPRTKPLDRRFGYYSHMKFASKIDISIKDTLGENMGLYEKLLWNKLVFPPQNVIVIIGGVGCGKTMSTRFVVGIMKDLPQHCTNIDISQHELPLCRGRRLHVIMDFNEIVYKNEKDYNKALQEFMRDLSDRMSSNLYNTIEPTEKFEFIDFWNYEINRQYAEGELKSAFSRISNEMQFEAGAGWKSIVDHRGLETRKEIYKKIVNDPPLFLDYQCRFWHYVLERVYNGNRQCIFVILDNIDCASPALQAAVREVVISHQKRFGNTFMVSLRPETLLARPRGVAATVIDIEPHCGPDPFDVVVDRLRRFVDNPTQFFRSRELNEELEKHTHELSKKVYGCLTDRKTRRVIREFIESLAGTNIRNALIMARNLLKMRIEEHDFTPHELNRAFISPPYERYSRSPNNPVENVFHVEGSPEGRLLVKGRVLQFLRSGERNTRTTSEIVSMLGSFSYNPELICKACNEMMEPAHQLIISNAKTEYSLSDFLSFQDDKIMLTYAGIGYIDKLIYDLDYISMIMLDCVVESSSFPILTGHGRLQRFRAVIAFLNELNKIDRDEMFELKMIHGSNLYISHFGKTMLTWEIIKNVCTSISRALLSLEAHQPKYLENPELRIQIIEIYREIASIMNTGARRNEEVLGEILDYVIPKPLSPMLCHELDFDLDIVGGYTENHLMPEAKNRYESALKIYQGVDDKKGEAGTLRKLGDLAMRTDNLKEAKNRYESALEIFKVVDEDIGEAGILKKLGDLAMRTDNLKEAKNRYESALEIFKVVDDKKGEAGTLKKLGDLAMRVADLKEAKNRYESALKIYQEVDDKKGEAGILKKLGDLAMRTDNLKEAKNRYESALKIYQEVDDKKGQADTFLRLGQWFGVIGELDQAENNLDITAEIYREIGKFEREFDVHMGKALVNFKHHADTKAVQELTKCSSILDRVHEYGEAAQWLIFYADHLKQQGYGEGAKICLKFAGELASKARDSHIQNQIRRRLIGYM